MDYSTWVGKKVYVSDENEEMAQEYKEKGHGAQCMELVDYLPNREGDYPFVVLHKNENKPYRWQYAVLADEEDPQLKFFEPCIVWREGGTKVKRRYAGFYNNRHYAFGDIDPSEENLDNNAIVMYSWDYAEPLSSTNRLTKKEICEKFGIENFELVED